MLSEKQQRLWNEYLQAEQRAPRAEKLRTLDAFLETVDTSSAALLAEWAYNLVSGVVDRGDVFQIRVPLFRRVIFPALRNGLRVGRAGCARWLAGLAPLLYRCRDCMEQLPPCQQTEIGLLRLAVAHDTADVSARGSLIQAMASRLRYTLHELPTGVLFGMNGATPEQCLELQAELEDFVAILGHGSGGEQYYHLIEACRVHYVHYRFYLLSRPMFSSYSQYLAANGLERKPGA